jgi:hypothetical protein
MSDIAEIVSAPPGTEMRSNEQSTWETASAGDKIQFNCEIRNTLSNSFSVQLYSGSCIIFGDTYNIDVTDISGSVLCMDSEGEWISIDDKDSVLAQAVGTGPGGLASVICSVQGGFPPPPWPPKK